MEYYRQLLSAAADLVRPPQQVTNIESPKSLSHQKRVAVRWKKYAEAMAKAGIDRQEHARERNRIRVANFRKRQREKLKDKADLT